MGTIESASQDTAFPVALTVKIAFPTKRLAQSALRTLAVDTELSDSVHRELILESGQEHPGSADSLTTLKVVYRATTNRMLRVAVNGFMESIRLIIEVMLYLDKDVLSA